MAEDYKGIQQEGEDDPEQDQIICLSQWLGSFTFCPSQIDEEKIAEHDGHQGKYGNPHKRYMNVISGESNDGGDQITKPEKCKCQFNAFHSSKVDPL